MATETVVKPGTKVRYLEPNEKPSGVVKQPGGGFVSDDGRRTPRAAQTAASRRREALLATDKTQLVAFEHEGETFQIAAWGRDDRQLWRESLSRAGGGEGEFVLSEVVELDNTEKLSLVTLVHGVRDEIGQPFFGVADVMSYRENGEDDVLLAALLGAIVENNSRIFGGDATVEKKTT